MEAQAKSAASGVANIGTLARSSLPDVASAAASSSDALGGVGSAASMAKSELSGIPAEANNVASKVADIGKSAKDSSDKAGGLFESLKNIASVTMTGVATGIGAIGDKLKDVVKDSYDFLSTNQQVVGGVEVLYGDAAKFVKKNAKDAYETAGMSANRYMDIATSLGAVLTNSVGGDYRDWETDRKSTRLNSSHSAKSRMPSSA